MRTMRSLRSKSLFLLILAAVAVTLVVAQRGSTQEPTPEAGPPPFEKSLRRPVALAVVERGELLLTANRRTGTISVLSTKTHRVNAEHPIGKSLSDLAAIPDDDQHLLATDDEGHRLLLLVRNGSALATADQVAVPAYPISVCCAGDGHTAFVASLWSRQVTVVRYALSAEGTPRLHVERSISLPFNPRLMVWLRPAMRLLVADAFGGQVAVFDPQAGKIESVRSLPAHNIRGWCLNPAGDRLLISHQTLSRLAHTSFEDIHWGTLLKNVVHSLDLAAVLDPTSDLLKGSRTIRLGDVGQAAGDPAGIAIATDSRGRGAEARIVVACAGVGEVALLQEGSPAQRRIPVGRTPSLVFSNPATPDVAYIVDTVGDTVTILHPFRPEGAQPLATVALSPEAEPTLADRGEALFHDARLSHDGWMSCQSCHTDGHTSGLLNDNRGDGSFDAPKRILSLRGVADTGPFAWNGKTPDLESQIRKSIATTMIGPELTDEQVAALAAYLRTLPPVPAAGPISAPVADRIARGGASDALRRGETLFARWKCDRCHMPPTFTSEGTYDVGFEDEVGNREFNPPSLRGVSQRDGLFHDNRAGSLEEAFAKFRHQLPDDATDGEIANLVAFLRNL